MRDPRGNEVMKRRNHVMHDQVRMRDDGVMVSNDVIDDRMTDCHFISPR